MSRDVVITGLGPITAFGMGIEPLFEALLAGRSAIGQVQAFDASSFPCPYAAEVSDDVFHLKDVIPRSHRKQAKVMCRDIELSVGAAAAAVQNAALVTRGTDPDAAPSYPPQRVGCHIGAGLIAAEVNELSAALINSRADDGAFDLQHWGGTGMQNLTPLWLLKYLPNMLACHLTIVHDCQGPSNTITCAEASAALSITESVRVIQRGAADACLSGGVESKVNPMCFLRQIHAKRLIDIEQPVDDPATLLRPFDTQASGTIPGEGGGVLVLEAREAADARGATPLAAIRSFACTQTVSDDTVGLDLPPDGASIADAMEMALQRAGMKAGAVDAVVPLGAGIASSDRAEAAAIGHVFGDRTGAVPIVTLTPNVGNCHAGAGGVAVAVAVQCLREQKLPARLSSTNVPGLNAQACDAGDANLNTIMVTTTSQGGHNVAIILTRE
jgi:3-oxoacyl-[acyl-carrier-protein] synthase II